MTVQLLGSVVRQVAVLKERTGQWAEETLIKLS